jgi:dCMP deaminase
MNIVNKSSCSSYCAYNSQCGPNCNTQCEMPQVQTNTTNSISDPLLDQQFKMSDGRIVTMRRSKAIKYYNLTNFMSQQFSKDPSTKVGALFMYPETLQILTMGYNGMPRGVDETIRERWERPLKYKLTEHAERNAIYNAAQNGVSLRDSICVTSLFPCADCARAIIQSGCKMVISLDLKHSGSLERIARWKPEWDISMMMLNESGVKLMFLQKHELMDIIELSN